MGLNALSNDLKFLALNLCPEGQDTVLRDSGALGSPAQQTPTPHSHVGAWPGHEGPRTREQPQAEGARHYTANENRHHGETRSAGKWEKLFPALESGALCLHPSLDPTKEGAHPGQTKPASPHDRRPFGKGPERGRGRLWGRTVWPSGPVLGSQTSVKLNNLPGPQSPFRLKRAQSCLHEQCHENPESTGSSHKTTGRVPPESNTASSGYRPKRPQRSRSRDLNKRGHIHVYSIFTRVWQQPQHRWTDERTQITKCGLFTQCEVIRP